MEKGKSHHRTGNKSIYRSTHNCPIYVHEYEKYEKYDWKNVFVRNEKRKNSKSVLNKIEETYWANWKPSKTKSISTINNILLKNPSKSQLKLLDHGDFDNEKSNNESSKNLVKAIDESPAEKLAEDNPKNPDIIDTNVQSDSKTFIKSEDVDKRKSKESLIKDAGTVTETSNNIHKNSCDDKDVSDENIDSLKHTDSIILAKRRQKLVKEYFQQPKCIRLYKKLNLFNAKCVVKTTAATGTLKPILKMESSIKETFHMGRPGSSILMTTASYMRKSTKRIF